MSLLGITLAVGLVVDDAIVMLENIVRHVEEGMGLRGGVEGCARSGFTIISISISLVAVFIPIFFMPGVIGGLFREFAIVVSLAILVSAMVCSRWCPCSPAGIQARARRPVLKLTEWFERLYQWAHGRYAAGLDWCLEHRPVVLGVAIGTLVATIALFIYIPKGFFPTEDIGQIIVRAEAVEDISYPAMSELMIRVSQTVRANPAVANAIASADETNTGRMFINLKPKGEREPIERAIESLRRDVRDIPGITVYFIPLQNLRIGGRISKARYQYVLKSVGDSDMQEYVEKMLALMRADPIFRDATTDAQLRGLQARVNIDRDKANQLGVQVQDIRTALYSTFGERQVSTIFTTSDSYPVILQAIDLDRRDESAFAKVYLRAKGGTLVPLSSIATIERKAGPIAINHAGQLAAITLSFNLAPGAALGDAARKVERFRTQVAMPASIVAEWAGDAAAFKKSQASQVILLVSALLVVYVLLGVL